MPPVIPDYIGGVGFIIMGFSRVWIIILAFRETVYWGLGCIFVPFATLYFGITRWHKIKVPFLIWLTGWGMMVISYILKSS